MLRGLEDVGPGAAVANPLAAAIEAPLEVLDLAAADAPALVLSVGLVLDRGQVIGPNVDLQAVLEADPGPLALKIAQELVPPLEARQHNALGTRGREHRPLFRLIR